MACFQLLGQLYLDKHERSQSYFSVVAHLFCSFFFNNACGLTPDDDLSVAFGCISHKHKLVSSPSFSRSEYMPKNINLTQKSSLTRDSKK